MQKPYKNLNKALLLLRNQVCCLKIWRFDELQLSYSLIIFAETSHTFSVRVYGILFYFI